MIKKTITYLLLILLGAGTYHVINKLITTESTLTDDLKPDKTTLEEASEIPVKTSESVIGSDLVVSNDSASKIPTEKVTREEQNRMIDEMNEHQEMLADTPELKAFFQKEKEVSKSRISRNFKKKENWNNYFLTDEYDPVWAPKIESEIDQAILNDKDSSLVSGMNINHRECKKNFCKLSFIHDVQDKKTIQKQQGQFMFHFSQKADVNLHRSYSYYLNEDDMMSYIFIERCLSCE